MKKSLAITAALLALVTAAEAHWVKFVRVENAPCDGVLREGSVTYTVPEGGTDLFNIDPLLLTSLPTEANANGYVVFVQRRDGEPINHVTLEWMKKYAGNGEWKRVAGITDQYPVKAGDVFSAMAVCTSDMPGYYAAAIYFWSHP